MPAGTLLRIEADLAAVIRERLERTGGNGLPEPDYLADMLARVTLAMIRSAMIRHAQLSRDPDRETVPTSVLAEQALSILAIPGRQDLGSESGPTVGETL
jgi:hypothetical protein